MKTGFAKVVLNKGKDRSVRLFHPWIFSGAIARIEGKPEEGDLVEVFSAENSYLATGHYHDGSIKVRIISFQPTEAGQDFWTEKIGNAYQMRKNLGLLDSGETNVYRLIHAEGDGVPGLIIDVYGDTAVIQSHTVGIHHAKKFITEALTKVLGKDLSTIYDKSADTMSKQSAITVEDAFLKGTRESITVKENGILFKVNWVEGQKTGFFIDQRENRALLGRYSSGKKVLNTFSYSGGFSMYALKAGATEVHSIDSSKKAEQLAVENAELNGCSDRHTFHTLDAFDFLKKSDEQYDLIILDPPAFAKHLSSVDKAMIGYRNLNTEGFKKVNSGGLLFTFSCSQVMDKVLFRKVVFQAAAQAKKKVRILYQLSQGPDHPINIYHPEGEYLKGLVLQVE